MVEGKTGNEFGSSVLPRCHPAQCGRESARRCEGKNPCSDAAAEETTIVAFAVVAKCQIDPAVGSQVVELAISKIDGVDRGDAFIFESGSDHHAGSADLFLSQVEPHFTASGLQVGESDAIPTTTEAVAEKDDEDDDDASSERNDGGGNEEAMSFPRRCKVEKIHGSNKNRKNQEQDEDEGGIELARAEVIGEVPGRVVVVGDFLGAIGGTAIVSGDSGIDLFSIPLSQVDDPKAEAGVGIGRAGVEEAVDFEGIEMGTSVRGRKSPPSVPKISRMPPSRTHSRMARR